MPLNADGTLKEVEILGKRYAGRQLMEYVGQLIRAAFQGDTPRELKDYAKDYFLYLWCGKDSPLFDKSKMATFERYFLTDRETFHEEKGYYFQLRKQGWLEELNLGMYRVQLGMGLVMNTGFHLGKMATLQSMGRSSHALTAHASRSDYGYLRGAAATVRLSQQWKATAFASWRPLDATLNSDGTMRTVVSGGYHRTQTELDKKSNSHVLDLGVRLAWQRTLLKGHATVSLNTVYTRFDRRMQPQTAYAPYRRYALAGKDFLNVSMDYSYTNHRLSFSGETAINRDGAMAALHVLSLRLSEDWTLMALHRYYGLRYTAFHAHAFSEGGSVQNEQGLYVGATWSPSRTLKVQGYADYARFAGPRYQVSVASEAFDACLRARTLLNTVWTIEGQYRFHLRQRDNEDKTLLQNHYEHRGRLRIIADATAAVSLQTQADGVVQTSHGEASRGIMVSEQASWKNTDDYDSRLYRYERSIRYDFSFPMYYGHGLRYALLAQAQWGRWTCAAKIGTTNYFDRAVISSGLQQIDHSSQTDLLLQLQLKI